MGKFALANEALTNIWVCRKCKGRNKAGVLKCRRCGSKYMRVKRKEARVKKG